MKDFKQKIVVITGAGSGMGRALAIKFAQQGALLELADVNQDGLEETKNLLVSGCDANLHIVDVAKAEAVEKFAEKVGATRNQVHLLINNAGVALGSGFKYTKLEDLHWIMDINYWGVVYGCKFFLPLMQQPGEHSIVNISSVFGLVSGPTLTGYSSSKFAVRGFSEALRQETLSCSGEIHVACAFPAGIKTAIAKNAKVYNANQDESEAQQGRAEMEKSFVTTAEDAADDILKGIRKKRTRIYVGKGSRILDMFSRVIPVVYTQLLWPKAKKSKAD